MKDIESKKSLMADTDYDERLGEWDGNEFNGWRFIRYDVEDEEPEVNQEHEEKVKVWVGSRLKLIFDDQDTHALASQCIDNRCLMGDFMKLQVEKIKLDEARMKVEVEKMKLDAERMKLVGMKIVGAREHR